MECNGTTCCECGFRAFVKRWSVAILHNSVIRLLSVSKVKFYNFYYVNIALESIFMRVMKTEPAYRQAGKTKNRGFLFLKNWILFCGGQSFFVSAGLQIQRSGGAEIAFLGSSKMSFPTLGQFCCGIRWNAQW